MTTPHERERSLEAWLRQIEPDTAPATDACLDAETAAAWADGALGRQALEQAQRHVGGCARCQALMRTLIQLDTSPVTSLVAPGDADQGWRRWLTWAVPLAATATALIAVVVWTQAPPAPASLATESPAPAMDVRGSGSDTQRDPVLQPPDAARLADQATQSPGTAMLRDGDLAAERAYPSFGAGAAASPQAQERAEQARLAKESTQPTRSADAANVQDAIAAPKEPLTAAPAPAPAAAGASASAAGSRPPQAALARRLEATAMALAEIRSPDPSARWRIAGSRVERTVDSGATWIIASIPSMVPIAGSAPSASVCWVVGRGGVVVRTTDGSRWTRLPFPNTADLVGVTATSADAATVTTADGRTFGTADGGATWTIGR
jgi:hypothetical protein